MTTETTTVRKRGIDWDALGGTIPGFDCLEMKRQAQERINAELAGMSREEELEYWRAKHAEFVAEQAALRAKLAEES